MQVIQILLMEEKTCSAEAILMSEMPLYQRKLPFFFLICSNSPKTMNQNTFRSELPQFLHLYFCNVAQITFFPLQWIKKKSRTALH